MLKHHDAELDRALDRLYLEGAVSIPWDYLYMWFNADRLGKGAHRDILRRWEELCTITYGYSSAPTLSILQGKNHLLTILREPFKGEAIIPFVSRT